MNRIIDTLAHWLVIIFLLLTLALSWLADHYRNQLRHKADELQQLQALVAAQNDQARTTLERLTTERDAAQAQVDTQHQQQEMADAQARQEIARLHSELERSGPVRVRISAQPAPACGPGGGGAPGHPSAAADPGAADAAPAYGLLPAANSARLAGVIAEIETLNAAYTSCRAQLMHP